MLLKNNSGLSLLREPLTNQINDLIAKLFWSEEDEFENKEDFLIKTICEGTDPTGSGEDEQEKLSLRYDMTVPLVRHVIMNKIDKMKRYTIGKVYRKETTNKKIERLREFHQADFDFVGKYDTNLSEIKIFMMVNMIFKKLKIENYKIKFNFRQLLFEYVVNIAGIEEEDFSSVCSSIDKLDKKPWEEIQPELYEKCIPMEKINKIKECLDSKMIPESIDCKVNELYIDLMNKIDEYQITNIEFDNSLARGLDYYTGIIFEIKIDGFDSSVGGGGRYDNLISKYDSKMNIDMIGISFGLDRLLNFINVDEKITKTLVVMTIIQNTTEEDRNIFNKIKASIIKNIMDNTDYAIDFSFDDKKTRRTLSKIADNDNYKYVIIIGQDELKSNSVSIKNFKTREQKLVLIDDILTNI